MDIKELEAAYAKAKDECYKANQERQTLISERVRKVTDEVNAIFAERCNVLYDKEKAARTAFEEASNADKVEKAKSSLPFPEGTLMVRKPRPPGHPAFWRKTERIQEGVLEIFRAGDECPSNRGLWRQLPIGRLVIRALLKGGKKSILFVEYYPQEWERCSSSEPKEPSPK